jgi:nucleotide-binding universal stress UspA family protein
MYTRIVVPVDGSLLAEEALPHAQALSTAFGAQIHLLRVIDSTSAGLYDGYGMAEGYSHGLDREQREEEDAKTYLAGKHTEFVQRGLNTSTELRSGSVVRELLSAARDGDLYVMASHGRTGMPRWFMGSIAEEMTRQSRVPVLLVRSKRLPKNG